MRKPFWFGAKSRRYLANFIELVTEFERLNICPPQKLLELGCGQGWMAEFLALMGFKVVGTSISPYEIRDANTRIESIKAKRLEVSLTFITSPMETAVEATIEELPFDAVFVFEALHHAFDWRQTTASAYACLREGGWFLLCSEPNISHTFTAYRIARLSNTHELGLSRSDLVKCLKRTGFGQIRILKNRTHFFRKAHWIAARK